MAINTEGGGVRKTVVGALLLGCLVLGIIVGMTVDPNSAGSPPSLRRDAAAQKALDRESEKLVAPQPKSAMKPVDAVAMKSEPLGDLPAQDDWEILFGQGAWGAEEDEKDVWNDLFKAAHVGEDVHQLDEEYSYSYTFSYDYRI